MKRALHISSIEVGRALYEWAQRQGRLPVDEDPRTTVQWSYTRGGALRMTASRHVCTGCNAVAPCWRYQSEPCCDKCDCEGAVSARERVLLRELADLRKEKSNA